MVMVMMMGMIPITIFADENEENQWNGKSAVFVGDSITAGTGTTKIYYEYLKESLGLGSVTAMGVPGSCISDASDYGQNKQPLINRYQNIPSADLIVIFMGTNDYGHETPLGAAEDTQDGTFYGALNTIIPALVAKHTSSKIVFVTSLHRYGFGTSKILGTKFTYDHIPNGVGATLEDYVNAVKNVCANNGVSVIDLYTECTLDPSDPAERSTYMPDGIHPNAAGHELIVEIMASHIHGYEPIENDPINLTEMIYGNKFAPSHNQTCRASSRINYYLKAGTIITLKDPDVMQWSCAKTNGEISSTNLGYFPDSQWTDKETAVVVEDGWVGFVFKYRDETQSFDLSKPLTDYITIEVPHTHEYASEITAPTCTEQGYTTYTCECGDSYVDDYVDAKGHNYSERFTCSKCGYKAKVSVLGDSISTYSGVSGVKNTVYPNSTVKSVSDTWWKQVIDMLGGEVFKINASGGSRVLSDEYFNGAGIRDGNYATYRDRCVNLHVGDANPDVVLVFMGTNDFSYHVESECERCQILLTCDECTSRSDGNLNVCADCRATSGVYSSFCNLPLGTADSVDVFREIPASSCEAYAIMLSKMKTAYPNAQIYCMGLLPRVNPYQTVNYHDHGQPTAFNAELKKVAENAGAIFIDLEHCLDNSAVTWSAYFGDAVHPTAKGMDKISEAVVYGILGKEVYVVSSELADGVALSGDSLVIAGEAYEASIITTNSDLQLNVQITMNGEDVTETVYNVETGKINIGNVTGNIMVTVKAKITEDEITWTIGTISTINGSDADNYLNRIRTGFIAIGEGVIVQAINSARINVVFYDKDYKILPVGNNCGWTTEWSSTNAPATTVYIRVAAKDESDMMLTVDYGKNIILTYGCIHSYENGICTGCGEEKPHTHSWEAVITSPTCTEKGYTTYTCVCGDSYVGDYVNAKGHTEIIDKGIESTCTESGLTEGKHCSVCGEILVKQETVKATGHSFTNYVSDKNATIYADGTKTATCDRCDATDTVMDEGSKLAYIRGDVNGDETLNSADAIYLLRHTIMPMLYPFAQPADMNGDSVVNSADAIYLLRHTIMPDLYPLR